MKKHYYYVIALVLITVGLLVYKYNRYEANNNPVKVFTRIYEKKLWGKGSGTGSDPKNAKEYMDMLQTYLNDPKYKTIVDLGCGDWQIMSQLTIPEDKTYIGYDLVQSVIDYNKTHYSKPNVQFIQIKSLEEISNKKADLLIIKDVIQHWPNEKIHYFIEKIVPNYKYALITNGYKIEENTNADIKLGEFRRIDLTAEPFSMKNIKEVLVYKGDEVKKSYLYTNPNSGINN